MIRYKLCPACGEKNAPTMIECQNCEADLTSVLVVTDADRPSTAPQTADKMLYRICDCGARNTAQARKCTACGEDISDIVPTTLQPSTEAVPTSPLLTSLDGSCSYIVCDKPLLLGRNQDMADYLTAFPYVSRSQARIEWKDAQLMVTSVSRSNATYLNNQPLPPDTPTVLHDQDELGLGGCVIEGKRQPQAAYFLITLPKE